MCQINQETVNVEVFYVPAKQDSALRAGKYTTAVNPTVTTHQIVSYFAQNDREIVIVAGGIEYVAKVTQLVILRANLNGAKIELVTLRDTA